MYVLLPATINEVLSLTIGPSIISFDDIKPTVASALNSFIFPSFISISSTEDNLPPYLAGKPPFVNLTFFIASALKTEKSPPICDTLYTGTPSIKIKFWSGLPPRT